MHKFTVKVGNCMVFVLIISYEKTNGHIYVQNNERENKRLGVCTKQQKKNKFDIHYVTNDKY